MLKQIHHAFDDLEFEGFRLTRKNDYTDEYFSKLMEEGSHYSKVKYLEGYNDQFIISIHFKLSWYYLFTALALVLFSFGILFLFRNFLLSASILLALAGISWLVARLFMLSAREEKMSMGMNEGLIDLLFEEQRKGKEALQK